MLTEKVASCSCGMIVTNICCSGIDDDDDDDDDE